VSNSELESKLGSFQQLLTDARLVARWLDFFRVASDAALRRINAYSLADTWHRDRREVLTELIYATRAGLVALNWDVVCPACSARNRHDHLGTVCAIQTCCGCGGGFDVSFDQTVEVTFTIHEGIRALEPTDSQLSDSQLSDSQLSGSQLSDGAPEVTGLDCATLPAFREFFGSEILSQNESLQVRDLAILFTDIKGSTLLYNRLGDARAYNAVRRHFDALFQTVAQNEGAIVKTIGDAIMASFVRPSQAMRAALRAQDQFTAFRPLLPDSAEEIIVKIGVHHGPCIAVTLNDRLDFFGGAINIAARAQQQAGGGETVITEAMYADPQVRELIERSGRNVSTIETRLRGFSDKFKLYAVASTGVKQKNSEPKSRLIPQALRNLLR
jgi:class 3 adenylate cyclase